MHERVRVRFWCVACERWCEEMCVPGMHGDVAIDGRNGTPRGMCRECARDALQGLWDLQDHRSREDTLAVRVARAQTSATTLGDGLPLTGRSNGR